jgi:hypothetical protein|uniref:Uncharacterized protein n=1 Tax=Ignisphaera aggregans TaxID=334771 RepID=A0A7J2U1K1_9CREN
MSYTELIVDEHKKVVFVFEDENIIIISDLYPCETSFAEQKNSSDIELNKVKIVFHNIKVSEPFLEGRIEFLCIVPEEKCVSISAILKVSYTYYKQKGVEELVNDVKKLLQQYEKCVAR